MPSFKQPNIVFIMSDDHAAHAISAYGSRINKTPHLDRIAEGGVRFDHCYCTNSICTPSRATILAGTYNHINGVTTLATKMDNTLPTYPKMLQNVGYQTAVFGKWHLGEGPQHCPTGFDDWAVLPGQGLYHNPQFFFKTDDALQTGGDKRTVKGYVTDIITDMSLEWLQERDQDRPFALMVHHKAPHREWEPDEKHAAMYLNETIPEPETLQDDYSNRARAAEVAEMRVGVHMKTDDIKAVINRTLPENELRSWAYQRYIKDYLRVIASIDDNVGRILDYLEAEGLAENTLIVYTSDQGFFLGDHGWYDKRFMYEESLKMPFIVKLPGVTDTRENGEQTTDQHIVSNLDFAPTILELAGVAIPNEMQGCSLMPLLRGEEVENWRDAHYYRYFEHFSRPHRVYAHYGIRTHDFKLIYYYADALGHTQEASFEPEWELFDLRHDPQELNNVYPDPKYADTVKQLKDKLHALQDHYSDERYAQDTD